MKFLRFHAIFLFALNPTVASSPPGKIDRSLASCPAGGILDSTNKFCCLYSCGSCGGFGCDSRKGGASGCCTSQIGESCSKGKLPCKVGSDSSRCPSGGISDSSGSKCCPSSCGQCGGYGCDKRPGGASNCCTSKITEACSNKKVPPCVLGSTPSTPLDSPASCPVGSISDSTGSKCCDSECGQCGGYGCHTRNGGPEACCVNSVTKPCSKGTLPCVADTVNPTNSPGNLGACPAGSIADLTGRKCCDSKCGQCGGYGCQTREGGAEACCVGSVTTSCSNKKLPCVADSSNSDGGRDKCPKGGIYASLMYTNVCPIEFCCPKSCSQCSTSEDCELADECCAASYIAKFQLYKGDEEVSCRYNDPPCLLPPEDDPCDADPCQNDGVCSTIFQFSASTPGSCTKSFLCNCPTAGNFTGLKCEEKCTEGQTPCGDFATGWAGGFYYKPNDICCLDSEECISESYHWTSTSCVPLDRPYSCEPNPCQNDSTCDVIPYNGVVACWCKEGWSGTYCEIEVSG